ncbi:hypothetical protein H072_11049 [Dactylellina haptotyla CBS 200.50]|uniref:Uncharacterized protein n=1 Tax=Dactylellina haptotyla (strain CBS 200.50) TaxID=1284197 RepID=S7ZYK3_DACHA|nr:hypothetical protein H072_11049 [Dactylellina haptotyla CBS 200.50]
MKQCFTPRMVRAELGKMPKTLDQTYDRILLSIPPMHQSFVQSALRWLAFSNRPLLLSELGEAAVIDPGFGSFDPEESRFLDPEKVLELCGSLVTLSTKNIDYDEMNSDDWLFSKLRNEAGRNFPSYDYQKPSYTVVALSHYSVKEYLTSDRLRDASLSEYSTTADTAHNFIAECSLLYLLDMGKGEVLETPPFEEFPLLEYCAVNWTEHYKKAGENGGSPATELLLRLFDESESSAYINWLNAYDPDWDAPGNSRGRSGWGRDLKKSTGELAEPLYWASFIGFASIAGKLVDNGADLNGSGKGYFGSPLAVAAYYRHEALVAYLLESGADANGKGGNFGSVLQAAAAGGSRKVVEKLAKEGADVGRIGGAWNTPLIAAATFGHDDVVSFLLKSRADLNVSSAHGSALYQAALAGDIKTVTKLLAAGSDINELGPQGTPLYAAALSGSQQVVQMLLHRGADVNKGGKGEWGYPLTAAAQLGNVNLVKVLLRAGAQVNARKEAPGVRGVSPLEAAIESRNLPTFQAIFEAGGDPNLEGHLYPNGLYAALWTGELPMARILLENKADILDETFLEAVERWSQDPWFLTTILDRKPNIDAQIRGGSGSALHVAIEKAGEDVVNILLAKDPYVNSISNNGTPLVCAMERGMLEVSKDLIKRGADIHREVPKYYYPFTSSIFYGEGAQLPNFELSDMLLGMGVDINGGGRRNRLSHAMNMGSIAVLEYLAKNGIDMDTVLEFDSCTPLQLAARNGNMEVIEALVNFGAKINGSPGDLGNTLNYAISSGREEIVRYFLKMGAAIEESSDGCSLICDAFTRQMQVLIPDLVNLGADVNKRNQSDWTPLALAIKEGNIALEKLLRTRGAQAGTTGGDGILSFVRSGNLERLRIILEEGVDPNQCYMYESPMTAAIKGRKKELVELLVEYGASVGALQGDIHKNPLGVAAEINDSAMLEYLLQMGADPNESKSGRAWALTIAAKKGNFEMVQMLLDNGADITSHELFAFQDSIWGGEKVVVQLLDLVPDSDRLNALNQVFQSAIHDAQLDLFNLLLEMGADVNFSGGPYGSPLHAAVSNRFLYGALEKNNRRAIFDRLLQKGATPDEPEDYPSVLVLAISGQMITYAEKLLKAGADPNGRGDEEYSSPLQVAARYSTSMLELLIESGAEVNAVEGRFGTALHVAAWAHDCERIAILLQHGAKIDLMSSKYGGVIQAAAKRDTVTSGNWIAGRASVRAMKLLLSRGASVNVAGGRYGNALQLAAKCDNLEGLQWLLAQGVDPYTKGRWGTARDAALEKKKWRIVSYWEQHYGKQDTKS